MFFFPFLTLLFLLCIKSAPSIPIAIMGERPIMVGNMQNNNVNEKTYMNKDPNITGHVGYEHRYCKDSMLDCIFSNIVTVIFAIIIISIIYFIFSIFGDSLAPPGVKYESPFDKFNNGIINFFTKKYNFKKL